ncbi:MAG: glutamyl-tRNA reductase, partial [Pseudohongiellaceae bacterium]
EKAYKAIQKGEAAEAVIESLARNLTNKLIHSPSVQMKRASAEGREEMLEHVRELFDLDEDE